MGTTFVSIREVGFWMRDSVLELWLRLLALHVPDPTESESPATKIRDQWLLASRGYFGGHVPVNLEEAVFTPEGESVVRAAIRSLLEALATAPQQLQPDVLNVMGFHGAFTRAIETRSLIEVGRAFLDLLDGKITSDASSTAFMPGSRSSS